MPSLRQCIRASDRAPMRLPLVFPTLAATYEYRVNGATSETGVNQDVNAEGEFLLGLFYRNAQGVITNAEYALTWQAFAQPQDQVGEVVSVLGRNLPPGRQVGLVLTSGRQRRRLGAIRRGTVLAYAPGRGDLPSGFANGVDGRRPDRQRPGRAPGDGRRESRPGGRRDPERRDLRELTGRYGINGALRPAHCPVDGTDALRGDAVRRAAG